MYCIHHNGFDTVSLPWYSFRELRQFRDFSRWDLNANISAKPVADKSEEVVSRSSQFTFWKEVDFATLDSSQTFLSLEFVQSLRKIQAQLLYPSTTNTATQLSGRSVWHKISSAQKLKTADFVSTEDILQRI